MTPARRLSTAVSITTCLVAIGIAVPTLAGAVAVGVALAATGLLIATSLGPQRQPLMEPWSPFGPDETAEAPTVATPDVADLARELGAARRTMPPRIAAHLRRIGRGRLLDGHRLDVTDPGDRERASTVMSPALAAIVLADDPVDIPVRKLGDLLDELERL